MIRKGIDHRYRRVAVVEGFLDGLEVTGFLELPDGVDLPHGVWPDIRSETGGLGGSVDIPPDRLPGSVFLRVPAREYPGFPGLLLEPGQESSGDVDSPPLPRLGFLDAHTLG